MSDEFGTKRVNDTEARPLDGVVPVKHMQEQHLPARWAKEAIRTKFSRYRTGLPFPSELDTLRVSGEDRKTATSPARTRDPWHVRRMFIQGVDPGRVEVCATLNCVPLDESGYSSIFFPLVKVCILAPRLAPQRVVNKM